MQIKRKIGQNRGKSRIWLEGKILAEAGWKKGDRFTCQFEDGAIVYRKTEDGGRKVAGDESRPIIDTNTNKITESIKGTSEVKVEVSSTIIRIVSAILTLAVLASIFIGGLPPASKRVLVACEFSGLVRDAFLEEGHDAVSCDLLASESGRGDHFLGDVRDILRAGWDLMISHPPCTGLALSGARWHYAHTVRNKSGDWEWTEEMAREKRRQRDEGLALFRTLLNAPISHIAIEQPKSLAARVAPKSQTIHPWQFGHGERKETWLWLRNLPRLVPTQIVEGRAQSILMAQPGPDRWRERSRTFPGIAKAMARQWGRAISGRFELVA